MKTDWAADDQTSASKLMMGGRKQLPPTPAEGTGDSQLSPPLIPASPTLVKNYGPTFVEYSLTAEYNLLQNQKIPGVYVIPSAKSPLLWFGVLFIRQGLYQDGIFKFSLFIPDDYPNGGCPRLQFDQPVFHPLIDPETGELDVKRAFSKWRRNVNHLWQVILHARRVFYKIDVKTPLNAEAAVLYEQNMELFKSRITESLLKCKEHLYDPPAIDDPHAIRFDNYNESVHEPIRQQILSAKLMVPDRFTTYPPGLSWKEKGSNKIFSKSDCPQI